MDWAAKLFGLDDAFLNENGRGGGVLQVRSGHHSHHSVIDFRAVDNCF